MKWTSLAICTALTALVASPALADYPATSDGQSLQTSPLRRPGAFNPLGWWTKFGEPVSAPVVTDNAGHGPAAVEPATFSHYGYDYVYGPGSCDCPAPCIDNLWSGYSQNPWRCGHHKLFHKMRGCGHCCDTCGPACGAVAADCGCGVPTPACDAPTCAAPPSCAGPPSCAAPPACGCEAPPACGCEAPLACMSCCKPRKSWFAHWHWGKSNCCDTCDSCAAPVDCGCAAPSGGEPYGPPDAAPPAPTVDDATTFNLPLFRRPAKPVGYVR